MLSGKPFCELHLNDRCHHKKRHDAENEKRELPTEEEADHQADGDARECLQHHAQSHTSRLKKKNQD